MTQANYNEQYSRQNNIKIMGIPENEKSIDEIEVKVCSVLCDQGIVISDIDIQAIHRISSKASTKPVLVKLMNNDTNSKVMRHRQTLKEAGHRLVDDVTKLNTGLLNRLSNHPKLESAWFYNGSIFGKAHQGKRYKFDIYDSVDMVLAT